MNIAFAAMQFAREAHKDQVRKYTGNPYTDHLAEVAGTVATVWKSINGQAGVMIAVAWLHDTVEDCGVELTEIERRFGFAVALGVSGLTDNETGANRAERKAKARERLAGCSGWIQTIKCADLISNTSSIVRHDPKFAVTYLEEKRLLLDVMTKADPRLRELAYQNVNFQNGK
ncbi:HD domain-containing protein [Comamonas sp. J-3]|uniref:HD domain-containing protein n=1 Tax=Comamonas trifloxystrobinivorans TaxID=3350256 RepID=UPI00372C8125